MDETPISRGFKSRRSTEAPRDRVPPGQHVTTDFPVLSAGPTPNIKVADWTLAPGSEGSIEPAAIEDTAPANAMAGICT